MKKLGRKVLNSIKKNKSNIWFVSWYGSLSAVLFVKYGVPGVAGLTCASIAVTFHIHKVKARLRMELFKERCEAREEAKKLRNDIKLERMVELEEHKQKTFKTDEQKEVDQLLNLNTNDVIENHIAGYKTNVMKNKQEMKKQRKRMTW